MTDPTEAYIRQIIPVGWARCTCGERLECPRDCEKFISFRKRTEDYVQKMFDDLVGI